MVPIDFPREPVLSALSGVQPKIAVRLDASTGRYTNAPTDSDVTARYAVCEDLAAQLVAKCEKNRDTKYVNLSEVQILERLLAQLLGTNWGSGAEMKWVIRRTAALLEWGIPESAIACDTMSGDSSRC